MTGYSSEQDKRLSYSKCEETNLMMGVHKYSDGKPKVKLGRLVFNRKSSEEVEVGPGRLSKCDCKFIAANYERLFDEALS